jgi:hypothetical protein
MCRNWIGVMDSETRTKWGIPAADFTALGNLYGDAQALLQQAQSSDRTPVITEQCKEAFDAMSAKMRFFKNHFFLLPPLLNSDIINLGLTPHDTTRTPTGTPKAEVAVETFLVGRHQLGVKIVYVSGDPMDRANKGFRIWYRTVAPGGAPVTDPKELNESFYTRRHKDLIGFAFEDSGKTVYIAVQIENDGKKGPWGPIISAVIP